MINFSELLWNPQRVKGERVSARLDPPAPVVAQEPLELLRVPTVEVIVPAKTRIALVNEPRGAGADRFRFLRMKLRELKTLANLRSIVITSPLPKDGKSTVALNVATSLTEKGSSVLLIDADLHHPTMAERLGLSPTPGLGECLRDGMDPVTLLCRVEPLGIYLLQAGAPQEHPSELLHSETLPMVVKRLSSLFDWVIIDTPPITPLTDAVLLSRQVDTSLLVVRADKTPREAIEHALSLLGTKHVLGILLNATEGLNQRYAEYRGYYKNKS